MNFEMASAGSWLEREEQSSTEACPGEFAILTSMWFIVTDEKKWKWTEPDIITKNGLHYVKISKWDRNFVRFATGKPLDLRDCRSSGANAKVLDDIATRRNTASRQAVEKELALLADAGSEGEVQKLKRKVRVEDGDLLPNPFVTVEFPEFERNGQVYGPLLPKLLWAISGSSFYIEAIEPNLLYLKHAVQLGLESGQLGRSRASPKSSPKKKGRKPKGSPKKATPKKSPKKVKK